MCREAQADEVVAPKSRPLTVLNTADSSRTISVWLTSAEVNAVDELRHAMATLYSLKDNLPEASPVPEKYVHEFHAALETLAQVTGSNLQRYRVPVTEIHRKIASTGPTRLRNHRLVGGTKYAKGGYCERSFLMLKIDTVLKSFQVGKTAPPPIGFASKK
jgi:hypothetical protein